MAKHRSRKGRKSRKVSKKPRRSSKEYKCMIYKKSFNDVIRLAKQAKKLKLLKSRFGSRFGRRFGSRFGNRFGRRFSRRFGSASMPGLNSVMGNYAPMESSIFSSYTGNSPNQMISHLENIPASLRDNFYSNQKMDY